MPALPEPESKTERPISQVGAPLKSQSRRILQGVGAIVSLFIARYLMSALGLFQLLVPFLIGFGIACLMMPPLIYLLYKKVLEATPGADLGRLEVLPRGELEAELAHYPFPGEKVKMNKTLEERTEEDASLKSVTWGDLQVQFQGKKSDRVLYYCVLKGDSFFFQNTKAKGRAGEIKSMLLTGSYVRLVDENSPEGYKYAIEIIQPDRCLLFKVDYVYLIANDDKNCHRWFYALRSICKPWEELHFNTLLLEENLAVKNFEKIYSELLNNHKFELVEPGNFLQLFLARLWIVLRESPEIKYKLLDLLQVKLSFALEDLSGYLSDVAIKTIDLGSTVPRLHGVTIKAPTDVKSLSQPLHTLVLEAGAAYTEGTVKIAFGTKVSFGPASTEVNVTLHVKHLIGKIMVIVPPYPHGRFALSFAEDPDLEIDIDLSVGKTGGSLSALPNKVQKFIHNKIRGALKEGFVWPNREYINLPFLPNNEPARPLTKMEVKNEAVSLEQLGIGIAGSLGGLKKDESKDRGESRESSPRRSRAISVASEGKSVSRQAEQPLLSVSTPAHDIPVSVQNIPGDFSYTTTNPDELEESETKGRKVMDDLRKDHLKDNKEKERDREKAGKKEREKLEKEKREAEKRERKEAKKREKEEKQRLKVPTLDPMTDDESEEDVKSDEKESKNPVAGLISRIRRKSKAVNSSKSIGKDDGAFPLSPTTSHIESEDSQLSSDLPRRGDDSSENSASTSPTSSAASTFRSRPVVPALNLQAAQADHSKGPKIGSQFSASLADYSTIKLNDEVVRPKKGHRSTRSYDNRDKGERASKDVFEGRKSTGQRRKESRLDSAEVSEVSEIPELNMLEVKRAAVNSKRRKESRLDSTEVSELSEPSDDKTEFLVSSGEIKAEK